MCRRIGRLGVYYPAGQSRDDEQPPRRSRRTRRQDVERAIWRNDFRPARQPETFSFRHHRRAAPRIAHLLRALARYSCRANIGSGLGPQGPGRRRKSSRSEPSCGRSASRRSSKRPRAAETSGSFTPRYEIGGGGLKPDRRGNREPRAVGDRQRLSSKAPARDEPDSSMPRSRG